MAMDFSGTDNDAPALRYASRVRRFLAFIVDVIVFIVVYAVLGALGVLNLSELDEASASEAVIQGLIALGYSVVLISIFGATLGKMALRIRVATAEGVTPGVGSVFIRQLIIGGFAPIPGIVLGLDLGPFVALVITIVAGFFILIDDRRQGLHDKAAKTFVIDAN